MRLDIYLTKQHNIQSRNKATELIKASKIKINGCIITKPSYKVENNDIKLEILEDNFYVSRSAYKLKYFLEELKETINLKLQNKIALDIGCSTGGFTQILLENGAKEVSCVDVGSNQLHDSIKNDTRLKIFENQDIRTFKSDISYEVITCDVSFISIHNILDAINSLASDNIIILFKPQFEVGREIKRDRAGVVQDKLAILKAREKFINKTAKFKWNLLYSAESKIKGKEGNSEELFCFKK